MNRPRFVPPCPRRRPGAWVPPGEPEVRLTPDGRVAAKILTGPRPWVAIHGGGSGVYLDVETYSDEVARSWRRFALVPSRRGEW